MNKRFQRKEGFSILDESSFIYWGKRKGKPVVQLAKSEPEYLMILHTRSKFIRLSQPVYNLVKQNINWNIFLSK